MANYLINDKKNVSGGKRFLKLVKGYFVFIEPNCLYHDHLQEPGWGPVRDHAVPGLGQTLTEVYTYIYTAYSHLTASSGSDLEIVELVSLLFRIELFLGNVIPKKLEPVKR